MAAALAHTRGRMADSDAQESCWPPGTAAASSHGGGDGARLSGVSREIYDRLRAAGNQEAWAAYFKHRKAERLASINNTPLVRGRNNSDGRRLRWGAPGRTLHAVLEYLQGGNDLPLTYQAASVPRQSCGS